MISGVILGLFIIPVLFVIFQYLQEKISGKPVVAEEIGHGVTVNPEANIIYS